MSMTSTKESSSSEAAWTSDNPTTPGSEAREETDEGGWDGWMAVAGCWCTQFISVGHANAFGVYEAFYEEQYLSNESSSAIAWIGSTQLALLFGMGLIAGPFFDKGYFRLLLLSSSALYIFCNFMLSITKPHQFYQIFLSQGLGMGLAMGMMLTPTVGLVGHHFRKRRGALALGIATTGAAIGGAVDPIMLNNLINRGGGASTESFQRAVRINGALNAGLLVLANLLMREKKSTGSTKVERPKVNVIGFLKERAYVTMCIGWLLASFGVWFPVVYVQLFSTLKGFSPTFSFYSLSILNGAAILGRVLPNFLADYIGALTLLIPMTFGMGATVLGYLGVGSVAEDAVATAILGFFNNGCISLIIAASANSAKHKGEIGARIGMVTSFVAIPTLIGPPINGALLTSNFIWSRPIIFSGVCTLIGAAFLALARIFQASSNRTNGTRITMEVQPSEGRKLSTSGTPASPSSPSDTMKIDDEMKEYEPRTSETAGSVVGIEV
ncbi:MFS general substrate transporter [Sistotremastrum suecicum HHB10207 ss-3]|uniref:MFS general substrate transporter n=1 Tax=Sistotremastrum suecicum HHB10207 ss-3 TaxID=1314776 RepID=A0A165ZFK8_9AGAM|nr:MFS general substrate transporter [Sistotremastrum suecicum HHB10207 ss-3]